MTGPSGLPSPAASRAVLIGVSAYEQLEPLPAVGNNLRDLKHALGDARLWGLPRENCTVLHNPRSVEQVLDAVHTAAAKAEDALLVYFAGHGIVSPKGDLCLALPSSSHERLYSAVRYDLVRHELVDESRARQRLVVLDCCYSGRVLEGYMGADLAEHTVVEGASVLTASSATQLALAPLGEKHTAFTGELLRALSEGVPHGPDPLTTHALYRHLDLELRARGYPSPQYRARNGGADIALTHNRWTPPPERAQPEPARERHSMRGWDEWAQWRWAPSARRWRPPLWEPLDRLLPQNRRLRVGLALCLPLVLVATLLTAYGPFLGGRSCPESMETTSGGCVGISDGSYAFPGLEDISRRILEENKRVSVGATSATVSLALVTPMTFGAGEKTNSSSEPQLASARRKLEAAYLAQLRANRGPGDLRFRLLLGNPGPSATSLPALFEDLTNLPKSREALRAVIGFDAGTSSEQDAVRALLGRGIPVVSSDRHPLYEPVNTITPDGYARVLPSFDEQMRAMSKALNGIRSDRSVMVTAQESHDLYSAGLRKTFSAAVKGTPFPEQFYAPSAADASKELGRRLATIADSVCRRDDIETVYFAGRSAHLRTFLNSVADSVECVSRKIQVVSGPNAAELATDEHLDRSSLNRQGTINVTYPAGFHPDSWRGPSAPATGGSTEPLDGLLSFARETYDRSYSTAELADSTLAGTYDAVLTAITGIGSAEAPAGGRPRIDAVTRAWTRLHGASKVTGVTGWICLDAHGLPWNKAVPVVRLDFSKGRPMPRLTTVAWPEGKPPAASCTAPAQR
ncbi:caspase domain-containing protein [Streptomyces sp. NPDC002795]|uniref:caspase family protein n=1 Tax=Streptomyces sp. NPDC002795 TaxID=3364665 RepID=UPI0036C79E8A